MNKLTTSIIALGALGLATAGVQAGHHEAGEKPANEPLVIGAEDGGTSGLSLDDVLTGAHRSDKNKARDAFRNPAETLAFFGLEPDMTVVEIWPGGGWYMEVIAPYVAADGAYIAAGFDRSAESDYVKRATQAMIDKVEANPELYGQVTVTELSREKFDIAPPESADMILTFRNVHNWMDGSENVHRTFAALYKALKPGGILGVVEHRASDAEEQDPKAASGYVREDYVIMVAEAAGFELVDRSDLNANPKDTRDHPKGVWTLPPSFRLGDEDREKYQAIGESDRMTLKFRKPATGGMAAVSE